MEDVEKVLGFVKELERLKDAERTAWTGNGRRESVAEHTFRLALFAFALAEDFPGIQMDRVILMCLVHDLGEAYAGDISAVVGEDREKKLQRERLAIEKLTVGLPELRSKILSLWEEYNRGNPAKLCWLKRWIKWKRSCSTIREKTRPALTINLFCRTEKDWQAGIRF
ncbi:hypothetical protein BpJC7_23220 [Weizmannia acidilactici]|uniref:5'-deoxynucleotidase n=1 Tax=Weizmannia acidilactici TaxID=2607726 RepID=A0A5J4JIB6_9BACI|nr:HD domain-containing protein [Weizmannia acidilactici]GER71019.1 hypothetical protein BpJC7_23220 [Weizmannia acidilactici]GER74460.1 hypothetical protein BpPP18_25270 [Weizmannia acidilactici]